MIAVDLNRRRLCIDDEDDVERLHALWRNNRMLQRVDYPLSKVTAPEMPQSYGVMSKTTISPAVGWKVEAGDGLVLDGPF